MKIHMSIEAESKGDLATLANMLYPFIINNNNESGPAPTPRQEVKVTMTSPPETMAEGGQARTPLSNDSTGSDEGAEYADPAVKPEPEPEVKVEEAPKPKRKRRTKAEMEAARAAEAAAAAGETAEEPAGVSLDIDVAEEPAEEPAAAAVEEPVVKPSPKNEDGLSVQDLVAHVRTYLEGGGDGEKVREILAEHGYERVSKVAVKDVSAVADSLRGLIDG